MDNIYIYAIIIVLLIIFYYLTKNEDFVSYMVQISNNFEELPYIYFVKYIQNYELFQYQDLDPYTIELNVMSIYKNKTYKTFSDDGILRQGKIDNEFFKYLQSLEKIAPYYSNLKINEINSKIPQYYININGIIVELGNLEQIPKFFKPLIYLKNKFQKE